MALSGPSLVILSPQNDFEVPPITTKLGVGAQRPAGPQPPVAVQRPAGAQPPPVAGAPPVAAQAVVVPPPPVAGLQPVLVTGQATDGGPVPVQIDLITVQVDDGPLIQAERTAVPGPTLPVDFSATVTIPDTLGPHVITVTATDDNNLTATATVTVWVGPAFAIAPASVLVELYVDELSLLQMTQTAQAELFSKWVGEVQQHLTSMQTLAAKYGLNVAGPAITLDESQSPAVLRIGLWITDHLFGAVPASPGQGLPLPTLSEAQAALCFAVTPQVLAGGYLERDTLAEAAVWLPTTTLQTLADAAAPMIVAAGARHNITVNTLTVSTSPPNTVTMTADCTFTLDGQPGTIGVTETLGTTSVSWETGDPNVPTELAVPVVTKTTPFSSTDLVDDILDVLGALFSPLGLVFASVFAYNNIAAIVASGDAATKVSGILGPLLSRLPYAIPFSNTFISSADPSDPNPTPFPVLVLNWTSVGVTDAGVVGGAVPKLGNRTQEYTAVTVQGQTEITVTSVALAEQYPLTFFWALENLDPDSFTWTLSHELGAESGSIVAGPFTEAGAFEVTIDVPRDAALPLFRPYLRVTASETCGSDPSNVLTGAWSTEISVVLKTDPGHEPP
jgi:hypothetical protein